MPACHIHVALGDVVELAELGVIHDTDLAVRPAHEPVAVGDRVDGLLDAGAEGGDHGGLVALVDVRVDRGVLEEPVLDLVGDAVRLLELRLAGAVGDVAVDVDGVPRTDERLGGAPLGVDGGLDTVGDGDEDGLLHDAVRHVGAGLGGVERDLGGDGHGRTFR